MSSCTKTLVLNGFLVMILVSTIPLYITQAVTQGITYKCTCFITHMRMCMCKTHAMPYCVCFNLLLPFQLFHRPKNSCPSFHLKILLLKMLAFIFCSWYMVCVCILSNTAALHTSIYTCMYIHVFTHFHISTTRD